MYHAEAGHGHAVLAAGLPPAVGPGDVQVELALARVVGTGNQVAECVGVALLGVGECAPRDGDEIGFLGNVHVPVYAVGKRAVVYPQVGAANDRNQVISAYIDRPRPDKGEIANDDVLALVEGENARFAITLLFVAEEFDERLAGVIFSFFLYRHPVDEGAAAIVPAHVFHPDAVEGGLYLVGDMELRAETGVVDAHDGLVAKLFQGERTRNREVAVRTVEHNDVVVLYGVIEGGFHVTSVAFQGSERPVVPACHGVGVARGQGGAGCPTERGVEVLRRQLGFGAKQGRTQQNCGKKLFFHGRYSVWFRWAARRLLACRLGVKTNVVILPSKR